MNTTENTVVLFPEARFQEDDQPPEQPPSTGEPPSGDKPPSGDQPPSLLSGIPSISVSLSLPFVNDQTRAFLGRHYPAVTAKEWNNWHWQLRNSIRSFPDLLRFIHLTDEEITVVGKRPHTLPLRITPWYLSLIDPADPADPLRKTMIPLFHELIHSPEESPDPLSEVETSPVPNLIHRYPDRVLFLSTGFCAAYCRYCTRSHMVAKNKCHIGKHAWEPAFQYIENHPEIRDVIVSGGDPLTMPDPHIDYLLHRIRSIGHVEMIRIGTKVPMVMPQRITRSLVNVIKKHHPVYMSIHATHPNELMPEVTQGLEMLANAGIPLGSQTVLLKGVNDHTETMTRLMQGLLKARVRPYYLYQCDPIPGSAHFRTTIDKGLEIMRGLRGYTSGYAVPHYVVDAPGGGGKIPLLPGYTRGHDQQDLLLENFRGDLFRYPDPKP